MRRLGSLSVAALAVVLSTAIVACSGPSNSGAGGRPASYMPGGLAGLLPTPARDPLGYDLNQVAVNGVPGGSADALGSLPASASASLVGHSPLAQVARLDSTTPSFEAGLAFNPGSIANTGSFAFAATRDPFVTGAGDLWRRDDAGGVVTWSLVFDGTETDAVVGPEAVQGQVALAVGSVLASGGIGPASAPPIGAAGTAAGLAPAGASLLLLDPATTSVVSSVGIGGLVPRAVVEFPAGSGTVYVGGRQALGGGGPAVLTRVRLGVVEPQALPAPAPAAGVRQEVTALLRVPTTQGGELLLIALGAFDDATGAPLEGRLYLTDGATFEPLPTLQGDAFTALAFLDSTIHAGTANGRLLYRDGAGQFQDEPGFPAVLRVTSLLARDRRNLLVGAGGANGALVVIRTGRTP